MASVEVGSNTVGAFNALIIRWQPRRVREQVDPRFGGWPWQSSPVSIRRPHLADVLERTVSGRAKSHQLHELLGWKAARKEQTALGFAWFGFTVFQERVSNKTPSASPGVHFGQPAGCDPIAKPVTIRGQASDRRPNSR
jgi:hypothetical protein